MTGRPWSATLNLLVGDYTIPTTVQVREMRSAVSGTVRMIDSNGAIHDFKCTSYDIYKLDGDGLGWRTVRQHGTGSGLRNEQIMLRGIYVV
jgi:hypothetical protein